MKEKLPIGIITTSKKNYSETFIRNHIQHLPFEKKVLYGGLSSLLFDWNTEKSLYNPYLYKVKKHLFSRWEIYNDEEIITSYLSSYLKKYKLRAVLAEFGPVGANVLKACLKTNVPLVVHFHGDDAHHHDFLEKYAENYRKLGQYAAAIIYVSETMKMQLLSLGIPENKIHKIVYGIDLGLFKGGKPAEVPPVFLAVGRFVDKKAPHLTILAFSKIIQEVPAARLIMVGTGPLLNGCRALVKALHIEEAVMFKGACTQDQVLELIKSSRAFIQHSVTPETGEKEGTPLSILEACAVGLPVVSTFHAGIPEAVLHEETGFLVQEYDIDSMAAYMLQLAKNPKLARKMGEKGSLHIARNNNLESQIAKLARVIENAIAINH